MRLWPWFLAGVCVSPAHAASPSPEQVTNEVTFELAECAAYFAICSAAMENSNNPDLAQGFKKYRDDALGKALIATKKARLKGETVTARYDMALQEMADRIGNNTSNLSILMADYDDRCIDAMTNVNKRIEYWRQKLNQP
jgi:hypothetical protein